ncbi:amidohydrolase family protein [Thalassotalea ganghwensis]
MEIIDPHLHLFNLSQGHYHWLSADKPPFWPDKNIIAKSFSEDSIRLHSPLTLSGFVHIEAGFDNEKPWREVEWLEATCQLPFRSVASIDLTLPPSQFIKQIKKLKGYHSVTGVRHILDEDAFSLLTSPRVCENIKHLNDNLLSFDVQMPIADDKSVNKLIEVIADCPQMSFIINHGGYPPNVTSTSQASEQWRLNLVKLAQFPNVAIKCSGWEMLNRQYTSQTLREVIGQCIAIFGADRVMLASNFPLTLFNCSYQAYWLKVIEQLPQQNTNDLLENLCFKNAKQWYKFPTV